MKISPEYSPETGPSAPPDFSPILKSRAREVDALFDSSPVSTTDPSEPNRDSRQFRNGEISEVIRIKDIEPGLTFYQIIQHFSQSDAITRILTIITGPKEKRGEIFTIYPRGKFTKGKLQLPILNSFKEGLEAIISPTEK